MALPKITLDINYVNIGKQSQYKYNKDKYIHAMEKLLDCYPYNKVEKTLYVCLFVCLSVRCLSVPTNLANR